MDHNWKFEERGERLKKFGEWHCCSGCRKRVFFPDGCTDFQKQLTVALAWAKDVGVLDKDELHRRTVKNSGKYGMDKGYHGVLAENCELAQIFGIEFVMLS